MTTETESSRRDVIVTNLILVLGFAGTVLAIGRAPWAMAYAFAIAFLVVLCHVCQINPAAVAWRMVRRAVGHRFDNRFTWGEFYLYWPGWRVCIDLGEDCYEEKPDHLCVGFFVFTLWLYLPFRFCRRFRPAGTSAVDRSSDFGFYTIDRQIVWRWGCGYWSWDIPFFSLKHVSSEILTVDGEKTAFIELAGDRRNRYEERRDVILLNQWTQGYRYILKSGETQERIATCYVERATHHRKWFPWLRIVWKSVRVDFNGEVGEGTGSWKGGTTGCGWNMLPGEKPFETVLRMERERKFDR